MKSLDVVVLCKIFILQTESKNHWTYSELANSVCLSVGETHASVKRLKDSHLFDEHTRSVIPSAMREFLTHGVKYAFPAQIGTRERGISTAHSAPILQDEISHSENDKYIWAYSKGQEKGISITPLSKGAPMAALKDKKLYDFLALLDANRVGKAREMEIAARKIDSLIEAME